MNEILELRITDLSRGGAGVAREQSGRVIFVPRSAPGDLLRVRIAHQEKRYAQGEILEVLEASPLRVQPRCPVFGKCGGCEWQHLSYEIQWKTKRVGVLHALQRVGVTPTVPVEELPAEKIWEYRNRVQLRGEREKLGFYKAGTHEIVPIERCEIARPEINAVLPDVRREGASLPRSYKVEVEVLDEGAIRKAWNARHAAGGFRQVHDEQNKKLQQWVGEKLSSADWLLDLYGGSGNLSLPLASRMKRVDCVDLGAPASRPEGAPAHFQFHRSAVLPWLLAKESENRGREGKCVAILDPPREGLAEDFHGIATSLQELGVSELALVGCDPDAWARDLSRFIRRGWALESVAVLDLFPQTHHVESLGFLKIEAQEHA